VRETPKKRNLSSLRLARLAGLASEAGEPHSFEEHQPFGDVKMKNLLVAMAVTAVTVWSGSLFAQESPTTPKAARVRITEGPKIELAAQHLTIISWTTNNPGGSPVHYGVVHYGTDRKGLSETAKSPIRLNPDHPSTVFRVRMSNLKPRTTYYYTVASTEANGTNDGVSSAVKTFKTP
jgi:hypothetical protein